MNINKWCLILAFGVLFQSSYSMEQNKNVIEAAQANNWALVQSLVQNGANVNERDEEGNTAFHFAIYAGNIDLAKFLLNNGADTNAQNNEGLTGLNFATLLMVSPQIVEFLLNNGADTNIKGKNGNTALYYAVFRGNADVVKLLVRNGAYINYNNAQNITCNTALQLAVVWGRQEIRDFLKDHLEWQIANPTHGVFRQAIEHGDTDTIKLILASNKLSVTKEDMALAKKMWLKTHDSVYQEIGKVLLPYQAFSDWLFKKLGKNQPDSELPKEITDFIRSIVNS
jgi:ankyrin repeat protein